MKKQQRRGLLSLAVRSIIADRKGNVAAMLAVGVSVFLVGMVLALVASFHQQMMGGMMLPRGTLAVAFGDQRTASAFRQFPFLDESNLETVKNVQGVTNVSGEKTIEATRITYKDNTPLTPRPLHGFNEHFLKAFNIGCTTGSFPNTDDEVLIGASVHDATGLSVGDKMSITLGGVEKTYTISGIAEKLSSQMYSGLPDMINTLIAARIDNPVFARVPNCDCIFASASTDDHATLSRITDEITRELKKDTRLMDALRERDLSPVVCTNNDIRAAVTRIFSFVNLFEIVLIVLVGMACMVNVANILALMISEHHRDIAIYKVVGAAEYQVKRIFLLRILVLGILGTIIGAVLSLILSSGFMALAGWPAVVDVVPLIGAPLFLGVVTPFIAGLIASRRTQSVKIAELLGE